MLPAVGGQHFVKMPCFDSRSGYVADPSQRIRGLSPLHDSGTGGSGKSLYSDSNSTDCEQFKFHTEISKSCHFFVPEALTLVPRQLAPGGVYVNRILMVQC